MREVEENERIVEGEDLCILEAVLVKYGSFTLVFCGRFWDFGNEHIGWELQLKIWQPRTNRSSEAGVTCFW